MNTCVSCGKVIPEGRQVCWICERRRRKAPKIAVERHTNASSQDESGR